MVYSLHEQWEPSKEALRDLLSPEDAESWLSSLRLAELSANRAVLDGVPNAFFHKRIARHFLPHLRESLRRAFPSRELPPDFELQLRLGAVEPADMAAVKPARVEAPAVAAYSFETFLPGEENRLPWTLAREVAEAPGTRYNPLLVVGAPGLGKSHLMRAVTHELRQCNPAWNVVLETAETFTARVVDAMRNRRMSALRQAYRGADALLLDDLGYVAVSPKAQEELLYTYEALLAEGRQMMFTADRPPSLLEGISAPLRSRLESALMAELQPPTQGTRLAIARAISIRAGAQLGEVELQWLAAHVTGSPRRLEGAILRIAAHAALTGETPSLASVQDAARAWADTGSSPLALDSTAAKSVLDVVAREFNLTLRTLRSRDRSPQRDRARQLAMLLLRDECGLSLGEIGTLLGNRANSTVLEAIAAIRARLNSDPALARVRNRVRSALARRASWEGVSRIPIRTQKNLDFSRFDTMASRPGENPSFPGGGGPSGIAE